MNKKKHDVSFEEAASVFYDDALEYHDPDHYLRDCVQSHRKIAWIGR